MGCSVAYSDRGSHYWYTAEAGGKVDKKNLTQFGRSMQELGISMIAAYSPEARGRSERMFKTLQGRLPNELALHNITDMATANRFFKNEYLRDFNSRFMVEPAETGNTFVPLLNARLQDILCLKSERTVGRNDCINYRGRVLQIPKISDRCHYMKVKVIVHEYEDGRVVIFHGPRLLGSYDNQGMLECEEYKTDTKQTAHG